MFVFGVGLIFLDWGVFLEIGVGEAAEVEDIGCRDVLRYGEV